MKKKFRFLSIALLLSYLSLTIIFLPSCSEKPESPKKIKYAFLFIGDGMGLAHVNLTEAYMSAMDGKIGLKHLNFSKFPNLGLASTYANNRFITGSAAAGTALATGHKTNINRISLDSSGTVKLTSIAELAKQNGMKTGIITTVSIDHATPAVFYAHEKLRHMYFRIANDLVNSDFNFFGGGGFLEPQDSLDGKLVNIPEEAVEKGYEMVRDRNKLKKLTKDDGKVIFTASRLADEEAMPFAIDADSSDVTLADITGKAIDLLDNNKGFFMMVEGGKIDWAAHSNDAATTIGEVKTFADAIAKAIEFYKAHPDETIIVVTADHETGGLALGNKLTHYNSDLALLQYQKVSHEVMNHIVEKFRKEKSGNREADWKKMLQIVEDKFGLNKKENNTLLSDKEMADLKAAFLASIYGEGASKDTYGDYEPLTATSIRLLTDKAGVSWCTPAHTGISVPVYSIGKGTEQLSGYIDNTDIPKVMEKLMGIGN